MARSKIVFVDDKLKESFDLLKKSSFEDRRLYQYVLKALSDIEENPLCAVDVPKRLIPKEYVAKYRIDNLRKYDLPDGWRLREKVQVLILKRCS